MKKLSLLLFVTALLMLLPMKSWSQEAYVWYTGEGSHTLTFCYDDQRSSREGFTYDLNEDKEMPDWIRWCNYIITVKFNPEFANARPTTTRYWFYNFYSINEIPTLTNLNTSQVTDMGSMFRGCSMLYKPDMSNFDTSNVTDMSYMFYGCGNTSVIDVSKFNTSKVTNMSYMFYGCKMLGSISLTNFDTSNVTDMSYMFSGCYNNPNFDVTFSKNIDTSKLTNMRGMFYNCSYKTNFDLSKFNTSNVTDMSYLFYGCTRFRKPNLSNFDTSNVEDMSYMFYGCTQMTNIILSTTPTTKLKNMNSMFYNCYSLTALDVSNFETSKVTNMSGLFYNCNKLTNLDVSNFNTAAVTNMSSMFNSCKGLTSLDVSNFDMSKVTSSSLMFGTCTNLQTFNISPTMGNISSDACDGVGTTSSPCTMIAPKNFDFGEGVDTSGDYFQWKAGYFKLPEVEIVISSAGLATFCYHKDLDFSDVTDYKAYVVGGYNSKTGNVTLVRVKDVPAGTGLILRGTAGTYKVPVGESKSLYANYLIGTTEDVTIQPTEGNKTNLVLSSKNGKIGFYPISSEREVGANKAYLQLPTSILSANGMGLEFEDGTTDIDGVEAVDMPDVVWYTIDGRRLEAEPTQKGLYIANGRKVVVP